MLSDEEKEALRNFKSEYETCDHYSSDLIIELDDAEIILNLIEKQSIEIEEYKKQLDLDYVDNHFVPVERYNQLEKEIEELKDKNKKLRDKAKELIFEKQGLTSALLDSTPNDKIKAKIDEVDKDENASIPDFIEYAKEYATQKLQSLLEKED